MRSSVVLGLVGAGGIGQELKVAFALFQHRNASAIILVIFVIVLAMELITDKLRARIQERHRTPSPDALSSSGGLKFVFRAD